MARHGKEILWQDYQAAWETTKNGLVELDEPFGENKDGEPISRRLDLLVSEDPSPEKYTIMREAYNALSEGAKEIIEMVTKSPHDMFTDLISNTYCTISMERFQKFLIFKKKWSQRKVERYLLELRRFGQSCNQI